MENSKDLYNEIQKILNRYLDEGKGEELFKVTNILEVMSSLLGSFIQEAMIEEEQMEQFNEVVMVIKSTLFNPNKYNEGKK